MRRRRVLLWAAALLAASCTPAEVGHGGSPSSPAAGPSSPAAASPSPLPSLVRIHPGGQDLFVVPPSIPPEDKPYPFATPAPPDRPTALDGTYMKIVPFTARPENQLPIRCFRCIPYRPDVGTSTLILFHGEYYIHHNLSGSKASGNFTVSGSRLSLFNDANCPGDRGTYTWRVRGHLLVLKVEHDPCPFDRLRAQDLTVSPWTRVDPCI